MSTPNDSTSGELQVGYIKDESWEIDATVLQPATIRLPNTADVKLNTGTLSSTNGFAMVGQTLTAATTNPHWTMATVKAVLGDDWGSLSQFGLRKEHIIVDVLQHCPTCRKYTESRYVREILEDQRERDPDGWDGPWVAFDGVVKHQVLHRPVEVPVDEYRCDRGHLFTVPVEPAHAPTTPTPVA